MNTNCLEEETDFHRFELITFGRGLVPYHFLPKNTYVDMYLRRNVLSKDPDDLFSLWLGCIYDST